MSGAPFPGPANWRVVEESQRVPNAPEDVLDTDSFKTEDRFSAAEDDGEIIDDQSSIVSSGVLSPITSPPAGLT